MFIEELNKQTFRELLFKKYGPCKFPLDTQMKDNIIDGILNMHKKNDKYGYRYFAACCMTINEDKYEPESRHTHTIPVLKLKYLYDQHKNGIKLIVDELIRVEEHYIIMPSINKTHGINTFWLNMIFDQKDRDQEHLDSTFVLYNKLLSDWKPKIKRIGNLNSYFYEKKTRKETIKVNKKKLTKGPKTQKEYTFKNYHHEYIVPLDASSEDDENKKQKYEQPIKNVENDHCSESKDK